MSEGIDAVSLVLENVIAGVNAEQKLVATDWKKVYREVLDLDDAEAQTLAAKFGILDLNDDAFEAVVKSVANQVGEYAALVLRILKMVLPKPVSHPVVPV